LAFAIYHCFLLLAEDAAENGAAPQPHLTVRHLFGKVHRMSHDVPENANPARNQPMNRV
jgi:phage-related protein